MTTDAAPAPALEDEYDPAVFFEIIELPPMDEPTAEEVGLRDLMLSRLYDPSATVPEPDYRLSLNGTPIMSAGNVSALVSGPKAGKSSVIVAAVAAGCGDGEFLGLKGNNPQRKPIIHLDTEQSRWHHDQKLRTVAKRLGVKRLPDHVFSWRLTGERLGIEHITDAIAFATERTGLKPYAVFLDGGVDFLLSPNDEEASNSLVKDLMSVADTQDCVVLVSIHFNPAPMGGPSKSRGHFGSELERKSEAYLNINKDAETQVRTLFTKFAREKEVSEAEGVRFAWDADEGMFQILTNEETGYSVQNVLTILEREGPTERKQLKKLLRENYGGDSRTWEARITQAHRDRLINTTGKPAKVRLNENGKCRLQTEQAHEEDGHD